MDRNLVYKTRRHELLSMVKEHNPSVKKGMIALFAGFEHERVAFRQESSFYYFTGIKEPGCVFTIDFQGKETVYVPNCGQKRSQWVTTAVPDSIDYRVEPLGKECGGYQLPQFFSLDEYSNFVERLRVLSDQSGLLFTLSPLTATAYIEQRMILSRIATFFPAIVPLIRDISPYVAAMRRIKDKEEIETLYNAVDITVMAHQAAAEVIMPEVNECEVQASLEYIFTGLHARPSFPSIVASGKNGAILHYTDNAAVMKSGDLVVVDIGAELEYYCADLTRTYPVSGHFTDRQKELYTIVLETQEFVAQQARPGMWLANAHKKDQSLHHLAKEFLQEKGYGNYFPHGIGHFLGSDVHDVGDITQPLQEGDVITIEPGIYCQQEGIGIRIEDNYWIVDKGAVCLSEHLPKSIEAIEQMVQKGFEVDDEQLHIIKAPGTYAQS